MTTFRPPLHEDMAMLLPTRANSHAEQHLNTLTLLIGGIGGAQHVPFDALAAHAPIGGRTNGIFRTNGGNVSSR